MTTQDLFHLQCFLDAQENNYAVTSVKPNKGIKNYGIWFIFYNTPT